MLNNTPITDAALEELDRLHAKQHESEGHYQLFRVALHNAYPALRQRLLEAESRLAEAEREIEFLRGAGEAEANFWVNVIRSLDKENLCDFFDGAGAEDELQRWLAAREDQQRREGAADYLEERATEQTVMYPTEMVEAAKRLREGK